MIGITFLKPGVHNTYNSKSYRQTMMNFTEWWSKSTEKKTFIYIFTFCVIWIKINAEKFLMMLPILLVFKSCHPLSSWQKKRFHSFSRTKFCLSFLFFFFRKKSECWVFRKVECLMRFYEIRSNKSFKVKILFCLLLQKNDFIVNFPLFSFVRAWKILLFWIFQ